jgi:hypothetical protein
MVAWAKHVLKLSFDDALDYVLQRCPYRLDTSLMYLDQLRRWVMPNTLPELPPMRQITNG